MLKCPSFRLCPSTSLCMPLVETTSNVHTSIYIVLCLCVPFKGYVLTFDSYSAFYWQCLFGCAAYSALLDAGRQECSSWVFFFSFARGLLSGCESILMCSGGTYFPFCQWDWFLRLRQCSMEGRQTYSEIARQREVRPVQPSSGSNPRGMKLLLYGLV